jgi:hypothetical protein
VTNGGSETKFGRCVACDLDGFQWVLLILTESRFR